MSVEETFQQIGQNGKEYRGAPFWSWNDDLQPEELRRQVRSMCESGMGGFFMHARSGLITPYMSEEYFECHRACIDEAKKLGMSAWLYDEDCWPSGSGGNVSPSKGHFYQSKLLVMDKVTGGEAEAGERTIAVYKYTSEGDAISSFERVDASYLKSAAGEPLLHCYWRPLGYLDVLSEEAVAQFIDNTHEAFAKAFSDDFGTTIPGIFTDEPNFHPAPWTFDFADEFKARMGYDIRDYLVQVFYDIDDYHKPRHDFWRVATELYVQAFSKQIYDWCEKHKLKLTGHQLWEDNLKVQVENIGAAMPHYEYMQMPGIDHLCRQITDPITVKQVSSAAHQFGGRRVLSETFGASGWNMSFEDQKWIGEWQYALGVNFMCQHLSLYSLKGCRKRDYPPSIYYQQPWWPQYNVIEDHFARLAYALTCGKHVADVLVIHPVESAWAEINIVSGSQKVEELNAGLRAVSEHLQEFHVDYDYGDESIMERHASIVDTQLKVGDAAYDLIILPPMLTLRQSTVDLLTQWIKQGGNIIICGEMPTMIDGVKSEELAVLFEGQKVVPVEFDALKDAVYDAIYPRVQVFDEYGSDATTIYFHQRDLGGKQLFYFTNIDNTDVRYDSVIRFRGSGKVEEWDVDTGEITELPVAEIGDYTVVEREFAPTQSRLLSFDVTQPPMVGEPERWMSVDEIEIAGPWRLERRDPNALTLDYCRYKIGDGEFSELIPAIWLDARLSRIEEETPVTLQYIFHMDFTENKARSFTLVMEQPEEFEISINGNGIKYTDAGWWCDVSFKKIDIELHVQQGENVIEMKCSYLGGRGRGKRIEEMDMSGVWARMWTNPPADAKDPILLPYDGEIADKVKEYNRLKYGVEFESIYILGDFGVYQDQPGQFVLRDEEQSVSAGDLVSKGYCFYRGTVAYEAEFNYTNRDEDKLLIGLDKIGGVIANIFVNGEHAGSLKWRPMEVEVSKFVKPGKNSLRIEITNTCRNLLGPHHHTAGELVGVGPDAFGAGAGYAAVENHGRGGGPDRQLQAWTDQYSFMETGLTAPAKLIYMRKE